MGTALKAESPFLSPSSISEQILALDGTQPIVSDPTGGTNLRDPGSVVRDQGQRVLCSYFAEGASAEIVFFQKYGIRAKFDPVQMFEKVRSSFIYGDIPSLGIYNQPIIDKTKGRVAQFDGPDGYTFQKGYDRLRDRLKNGQGVTLNFVDAGWDEQRNGIIQNGYPLRTGHTVALVDINPIYLTFKNSWGPHWGDHGYGYYSTTKLLHGGASSYDKWTELFLHPDIQKLLERRRTAVVDPKVSDLDLSHRRAADLGVVAPAHSEPVQTRSTVVPAQYHPYLPTARAPSGEGDRRWAQETADDFRRSRDRPEGLATPRSTIPTGNDSMDNVSRRYDRVFEELKRRLK